MKLRRDRGALRLAAAALGMLLAQSLVPHLALAQGMGGMVMPGATTPPVAAPSGSAPPVAAPRVATPRVAAPLGGTPPVAVPPGGTPPVVTPGLGGGVAPVGPQDPAATAGWPSPVNDSAFNSFLLFDLLEFQHAPNVETARWDVVGWYGGDTERVWFKSEGRYNGALRTGEMDLQLLYGRLIFPFVDLQAGVRYEQQLSWDNGLGRGFAVLGVQGLVPYGMELEAAIFLSQDGDLSTRVTLAQDFLLTQRLILQPRFELNAALQSATRYGVGAGLNDIEVGLRLRYEIVREFAPYVGVSWLNSFGETATLRSAGGENRNVFQLVAGFRMWF